MKLKFSLFLFLVGLSFGVAAQEESQPAPEIQELNQQHPDLNLNDDKTLLDVDAKPSKGSPATREISPANGKGKIENSTKAPANDKVEEDPLSFNFLYFIIQKFKISDIVDD